MGEVPYCCLGGVLEPACPCDTVSLVQQGDKDLGEGRGSVVDGYGALELSPSVVFKTKVDARTEGNNRGWEKFDFQKNGWHVGRTTNIILHY